MIISRTPFRVSLFGGGTDYPMWYLEHGGAVFGFAINRYCYITLRRLPPFFTHRHRMVYSKIEMVSELGEIEHPAIRAVLSDMGVTEGLEIHHDGDLPARSGLGSSSSFTVGLINALNALYGRRISKYALASEAMRIEQDVIRESVGSQDQVWAAYGGLNRIEFDRQGFHVSPIITTEQRLHELFDHVVLYFTGFQRFSSDIAKQTLESFGNKYMQLTRMRALVDEAGEIVGNPSCPITEIGELLHESWVLKKNLSPIVTNGAIDDIYEAGRKAGAIGGKLLGAGAGGFFLFFVSPERRAALRQAMRGLVEVDIDLDRDGSSIVLFEPNGFSRRASRRSSVVEPEEKRRLRVN
jgi:D-glycero-alpha-D-manno-heptose-7-phosphate kinase